MDGLEVKVQLGTVWKQSLTELSGGQRYVKLLYFVYERSVGSDGIFIANLGHLSLFPLSWPFSNSNLPRCIS